MKTLVINKIIVSFSIAALALGATTTAFALEENMKNYRGARSLGMGGLLTTTGLYEEALFGNPAMQAEDPNWKISLLNTTVETNSNLISDLKTVQDAKSASGSAVISTIADKGLIGHNEHIRLTVLPVGFYFPRFFSDKNAFALTLLINTQHNIMLRSNAQLDVATFTDVGPAIGFARRFLDDSLSVGINARMVYRVARDEPLYASDFLAGKKLSPSQIAGQGIGIDGDLGANYKLPFELPVLKKISVAASLNNLMQSTYRVAGKEIISTIKSTPPNNDRTLSLGARVDFPDLLVLTNSLFAAEVHDIGTTRRLSSTWKKLHLGAETRLLRFLLLRGGINQGYFGAGLGLDLPILKVDVATYGEEMTGNAGGLEDRRYLVRFSFDI